MTLKLGELLLLGGAAYLFLKNKGGSSSTPPENDIVPPGYQRLASGELILTAPLADSGLIVGGASGQPQSAPAGTSGFPQVVDPTTGETIAIDPQGAVATGGGIGVDSSGFLRFSSGGFVKTTVAGSGIAGTEDSSGGIFGATSQGGEIIPASFEDPKVLASKAKASEENKKKPANVAASEGVNFTPANFSSLI